MTDAATLRPADVVVIYGLDTCEDTTRARQHLTAAGVAFRYMRIDEDDVARERVHLAGYFATPVVVTPSGRVYIEPSDDELDAIVTSAV